MSQNDPQDWRQLDHEHTRRGRATLLLTVLSSAAFLLMFAYVGYAVFA